MHSTVDGDGRMAFFEEVLKWTNIYAASKGAFNSYGHNVKPFTIEEIVRFFGILLRDGALGGSGGNIHRRWQDSPARDAEIARSMTYSRFLEIKRYIKLCNNLEHPQRGMPNYDPTYKFDYIWKVIVHNTN